jgi:hypothetical protein
VEITFSDGTVNAVWSSQDLEEDDAVSEGGSTDEIVAEERPAYSFNQ